MAKASKPTKPVPQTASRGRGAIASGKSAAGDPQGKPAKETPGGREAPKRGSRGGSRGSPSRSIDILDPTFPIDASLIDGEDQLVVMDRPMVGTIYDGTIKLNEYRLPAMKNVGKDADGKVIPHIRSEKTAAVIARWVAAGAELNFIAAILNIRPGLVKQQYANELEHGAMLATTMVANAVFKEAVNGDINAAKFFLKSRAGWRDGDSANGQTSALFNIHIHG